MLSTHDTHQLAYLDRCCAAKQAANQRHNRIYKARKRPPT